VIRLLVDVNLSPSWIPALAFRGVEAVHWATVGDPRAPDDEIMRFTRAHADVVFTHDLDFGALLALTRSHGPSVVQIPTQNVLPSAIADLLVRVPHAHSAALETGALLTVDERNARVRVLPLR
jgi:predicted nuclease of predicted toxin-antitoxin system